jgi:septin family protein
MKDEKQIKMTFLGNSGVGKSSLMATILKPKSQTNGSSIDKPNKEADYLHVNYVDAYLECLNKKYKVNIVEPVGSIKKMDDNYMKN